jgi:hypothetical protein
MARVPASPGGYRKIATASAAWYGEQAPRCIWVRGEGLAASQAVEFAEEHQPARRVRVGEPRHVAIGAPRFGCGFGRARNCDSQLTRPRASECVEHPQSCALSYGHDITRLAIETRKDQIESLEWQIKPIDTDEEPAGDVKDRIAAITKFLRKPGILRG